MSFNSMDELKTLRPFAPLDKYSTLQDVAKVTQANDQYIVYRKVAEQFATVFEVGDFRIDSMGDVRHQNSSVLATLPPHVVKAFGHEHSCIIYWQQGDIENQAHNLGYHLKDAEVNEVLARMEKTHDPQHGMHWEWVDQTIMQVVGERK